MENRKLELPSSNSSKLGKLELAKFKVGKVRVGLLMHKQQKTHDTAQNILFFSVEMRFNDNDH